MENDTKPRMTEAEASKDLEANENYLRRMDYLTPQRYRVYCPDLPADARPQLTREYAAQIKRKEPVVSRARPVCSGCGLQLPATGICDDC